MKTFVGTLVHSTKTEPLEVLQNKLIAVKDGKIQLIEDADKVKELLSTNGVNESDITYLGPNEFLMPGLVDTHIHASQYVNTGTALNLPLLKWLETYTFPTEAKFADLQFAEEAYTKAVNRVLKNGTTTACYFATIHTGGTLKLCDVVEKFGQRAFVGKVCMDCNSASYYQESMSESIASTEEFVQKVLERKNPLLTPVITPRFAITCTADLLKNLGHLAKKYELPVQTHVSETAPECEWIQRLFPESKNYTDVYATAGLLTNRSVLAHGVFLTEEELTVIREKGSGISHCPNSNTSIRSGLCDVRRLLDNKIKVGLGTDVSGGYHASLFDAMRYAVQISNIIYMQEGKEYRNLDYKEAFRLATLGGSEVLGLADKIGNFEVGKDFDALRITPEVKDSPFDLFSSDAFSDVVQKFCYLGDDRNITEVYVAGKRVL